MEIWDGQVRQPGKLQGFQVKRKWSGLLPLTIAEVRLQFGKIHGTAQVVSGAILFGILMPSMSNFRASEKADKTKECLELYRNTSPCLCMLLLMPAGK